MSTCTLRIPALVITAVSSDARQLLEVCYLIGLTSLIAFSPPALGGVPPVEAWRFSCTVFDSVVCLSACVYSDLGSQPRLE